MSIFEYDEEREKKLLRDAVYKQGLERGLQSGQQGKLISLIYRKIQKGKNLKQIAEEVEEEVATIEPLYQIILDNQGKNLEEVLELYNHTYE